MKRARKEEQIECGLCGRSVTRRNARRAPIIGLVGPTCYTKVSALGLVLKKNNLGALLEGAVRITRAEVEAGTAPIPKNAQQAAYELGFYLRSVTEKDNEGHVIAATFWLELRSPASLKRKVGQAKRK